MTWFTVHVLVHADVLPVEIPKAKWLLLWRRPDLEDCNWRQLPSCRSCNFGRSSSYLPFQEYLGVKPVPIREPRRSVSVWQFFKSLHGISRHSLGIQKGFCVFVLSLINLARNDDLECVGPINYCWYLLIWLENVGTTQQLRLPTVAYWLRWAGPSIKPGRCSRWGVRGPAFDLAQGRKVSFPWWLSGVRISEHRISQTEGFCMLGPVKWKQTAQGASASKIAFVFIMYSLCLDLDFNSYHYILLHIIHIFISYNCIILYMMTRWHMSSIMDSPTPDLFCPIFPGQRRQLVGASSQRAPWAFDAAAAPRCLVRSHLSRLEMKDMKGELNGTNTHTHNCFCFILYSECIA